MSSDFEGLPIAMLEAMALKKPVVATTVGGIPGVVRDGVDGYLVPPKNPQALADKMLLLVNDYSRATVMGLNAEQRVREHYDISRMVLQVEAIYRKVLAKQC
jgi:glycosyltransferase involved in cell wall biosynthesis